MSTDTPPFIGVVQRSVFWVRLLAIASSVLGLFAMATIWTTSSPSIALLVSMLAVIGTAAATFVLTAQIRQVITPVPKSSKGGIEIRVKIQTTYLTLSVAFMGLLVTLLGLSIKDQGNVTAVDATFLFTLFVLAATLGTWSTIKIRTLEKEAMELED